jgi:hypothetical protein
MIDMVEQSVRLHNNGNNGTEVASWCEMRSAGVGGGENHVD